MRSTERSRIFNVSWTVRHALISFNFASAAKCCDRIPFVSVVLRVLRLRSKDNEMKRRPRRHRATAEQL